MSIKLVAIDIDGTLVNNNREITPEVFEAIQKAKAAGVKIVIATGRPLLGVIYLIVSGLILVSGLALYQFVVCKKPKNSV